MSRAPHPDNIFFHDYSRNALLLNLTMERLANGAGTCPKYKAFGHSGLSREEGNAALDELVAGNHVVLFEEQVPIAEWAGKVLYGSQITVQLLTAPATTHERLSPGAWASIRSAVFERDDFTCQYCGAHGVALECDHVTPISRGGTNEMGNLVTACRKCNKKKRDKLLEEWRREVV